VSVIALVFVGATTAARAATGAVVLSVDQASGALLTVDDVGSDWIALPPGAVTLRRWCGAPTSPERATADAVRSTASIELAADQNVGPFVQSDVYGFSSVAHARHFVQQTARAVLACPSMSETDSSSGEPIETSFDSLTTPRIGDQIFSFEATIDVGRPGAADAQRSIKDVAFVRDGSAVAVIGLSASDSDSGTFQELVRRGNRRLVAALRATAAGAPPSTTVASGTTPASCADTVANAPTPLPPTKPGLTVVQAIRMNVLAALPLTDSNEPRQVDLTYSDTIDIYLDGLAVPDMTTWRAAMADDGFVIAENAAYERSSARYGASALQFASPEKALDFQRRTLTATCAAGVVHDIAPVPEVPGALAYRSVQPGQSPYRVSMIVGPEVVQLNLCECTTTSDRLALVGKWATAVADDFGTK
jgi:hypothetical protein